MLGHGNVLLKSQLFQKKSELINKQNPSDEPLIYPVYVGLLFHSLRSTYGRQLKCL